MDKTTPGDDPRREQYDAARKNEAVEIKGGKLHEQADRLEYFLTHNPGCGIYQRGGQLVEIATVPAKKGDLIKREDGSHVIVSVTATRLRELGTRFGQWQKYDARKDALKFIDCPREVAETLAARASWQLPVLTAVLGAPTIGDAGVIISKPGFNEDPGVYLHIDNWKSFKKKPSRDDAVNARALLEDLVSEFPFTDAAARATWLAALITALIRWSLRTAPFFGFDAPVMGSGKTLLAILIGILISGREPATMSQAKDEAEARKGILAALMAGDPLLLIDNIEHTLAGEALCSVATSETYRDRLLGKSQMITVSTSVTVMLTGNNLTVRGDLSTRLLMARLDPGIEHPEERAFKRDNIRKYTNEHRQDLVNAALTILRAYELAGRPAVNIKPFGRFEDWSNRVRAPLIWSGSADPCETRQRVEVGDPEREQHSALINAWWEMYGSEQILLRKIISDATSGGDDMRENLRAALLNIAGDGNKINAWRLGKRVAKWEGRVQDNMRIVRGLDVRNSQPWTIQRVGVGLVASVGLPDQNIRNCQKETIPGESAEQTAQTDQTDQTDKVRTQLESACAGLYLPPGMLEDQLSSDDLQDISTGKMTAADLRGWAEHFDKQLRGEQA